MKKLSLLFLSSLLSIFLHAQTAQTAPLPAQFDSLENILLVNHFPSPVLASEDAEQPGIYFWKHNTAILSPTENITIEAGGAYIFYNKQWNLRINFTATEVAEIFNISSTVMKAGQPYTFVDNWRTDHRLLGGWALWYIIGRTETGKRVFGIGLLETAGRSYSD